MAPDVDWKIINKISSKNTDINDEDLMERGLEILKEITSVDYKDDLEKCYAIIKSCQRAISVSLFSNFIYV